jgi:putative ABC transport system permease protein
LRLLGIDIFTLAQVTPLLLPHPAPGADRYATLAGNTLFLSSAARLMLGVKNGDTVQLQAGGHSTSLKVAGDLPGMDAGISLGIMDIAALQARFGQIGRLTRVDVKLDPAAGGVREHLQAMLPAGVQLIEPQAPADQAGQLSRAYRVNLGMLAAIALLTAVFLVFSAQAVSVVRRRTEFAFLRAIGLARHQLLGWVLAEGAVLGAIGGVLGVGLGYGLAWGALRLLGGDLGAGYFSGLHPRLEFSLGWSALYLTLGVLAGLAGAWMPARQAADISPAYALKSADEAALPAGHGMPRSGVALLLLAALACLLPPLAGLPLGGYLACLLLLAGAILLLPLAAALAPRALGASGNVPLRLAAARLAGAPGYAVVAAAGVLTSVALAVAMAIMVASFRESVDDWLSQVLPADLYLHVGDARSGGHLEPELQARIAAVPGVGRAQFARRDTLRATAQSAPITLIARPLAADGHDLPLAGKSVAVAAPRVWISEAQADIAGWRPGQSISLPLAGVQRSFNVAGIWRDYARQSGAVVMDLATYRPLTGDLLADDAAITLAPDTIADHVITALQALVPAGNLEITRAADIRKLTLKIFDRTFAITYLLEAVAIFIGLCGVAASFAALAAARRKEFGMLRHLGISRGQIGAMLALEGALVAGTGVLAGCAAGAGIGWVLIEVVDRQSFHWSMDLHVPWAPLALFALAMVLLAGAAAVASGRQAMRHSAVLAVREDW